MWTAHWAAFWEGKMKKSICIILLLFILLPAFSLTKLEIGSKVPKDAVKIENQLILSAPSQFQNLYEWTENNTKYHLGVDKNGYVQFICLASVEKCTEENIKVEDTFSKVKNIKGIKIEYWFEWGYCVELPSGWILKFKNNEDYDFYKDGITSSAIPGKRISKNATVDFIFKGTGSGYGERLE